MMRGIWRRESFGMMSGMKGGRMMTEGIGKEREERGLKVKGRMGLGSSWRLGTIRFKDCMIFRVSEMPVSRSGVARALAIHASASRP